MVRKIVGVLLILGLVVTALLPALLSSGPTI
jgi:hypothetical protein